MFALFQVHRSSCMLFDQTVLQGKPRSGWAAALANCQHTYQHSNLTLGAPRAGLANYGAEFITVPSDSSSESSGDDEPLSKRPKLDQSIRPEQYPHISSSLPAKTSCKQD